MIYEGMSRRQSEMYDKGRKLYADGKKIDCCIAEKFNDEIWIKAGWIDADIEAGNRVLQCDVAS